MLLLLVPAVAHAQDWNPTIATTAGPDMARRISPAPLPQFADPRFMVLQRPNLPKSSPLPQGAWSPMVTGAPSARGRVVAEPRADVVAEPRADVVAEPRADVPAEPRGYVPAEPRGDVAAPEDVSSEPSPDFSVPGAAEPAASEADFGGAPHVGGSSALATGSIGRPGGGLETINVPPLETELRLAAQDAARQQPQAAAPTQPAAGPAAAARDVKQPAPRSPGPPPRITQGAAQSATASKPVAPPAGADTEPPGVQKSNPLEDLPPDATPAQQYCFNTAESVADARVAWQAKKIKDMEAELDKRIAELKLKTDEYKQWLARRDEFSRKAQEKLVAFYAKMKPDAAASQMSAMDEETAAALLMKLEPKVASLVLAEIAPERAAKIASIISGAAKKPPERRSKDASSERSGAKPAANGSGGAPQDRPKS